MGGAPGLLAPRFVPVARTLGSANILVLAMAHQRRVRIATHMLVRFHVHSTAGVAGVAARRPATRARKDDTGPSLALTMVAEHAQPIPP